LSIIIQIQWVIHLLSRLCSNFLLLLFIYSEVADHILTTTCIRLHFGSSCVTNWCIDIEIGRISKLVAMSGFGTSSILLHTLRRFKCIINCKTKVVWLKSLSCRQKIIPNELSLLLVLGLDIQMIFILALLYWPKLVLVI